MKLYEKMQEAWNNTDVDAWNALRHEDFQFTRHQSGRVVKKNDMDPDEMKKFMKVMKQEKRRCIYENDDVLVSHSLVSFPDGSSEAVLVCFTLSNDKIIRSETGATPIS